MNILFVHEICGWLGGVEQNVADASRLQDLGHLCYLAYATRGRDADAYAALFDGAASLEGGLAPLLRRYDPDVVYIHKLDSAAALLPACAGRRTVRMVHDHDLTCPRSHKYYIHNGRVCTHAAGWRCWLDGAFVARTRGTLPPVRFVSIGAHLREMRAHAAFDGLIVASRYMRDQLVLNGLPASRVAIVPPAIDLGVSTDDDEVTTPPGQGRVLYVGQLIRGKGVDLLLEALSRIERPVHLDLVGVGNARSALEAQAHRLGLAPCVHFHGWIPPTAQHRLYARCDVAAVPSRWPEPFGLVGLQAMTHGRAVIAFDVGGIADWLDDGETGLLVAEQDVPALAAAVKRLLDEPATAARMGRVARARVRERFSFARYLRALEEALAPPPQETRDQ